MIKKIVFKNLNTSLSKLAMGKIKIYDNANNLIKSGNVIKDIYNECETDNFKCVVSSSYMSNYPINMINTNTIDDYWMINNVTNTTIEIYFKKYIDGISKISFIPLPSNYTSNGINQPFNIEIYDYDDNIIKTYDIIPITTRNTEQILETIDLLKFYSINSIETINTLDNKRLNNVYRIKNIKVEQEEPINTCIRYLFSIDDRQTWFNLKNNKIISVDISDILTDGMNKDDLENINYEFDSNVNLDIMIGLSSSNKSYTPIVHAISIQY